MGRLTKEQTIELLMRKTNKLGTMPRGMQQVTVQQYMIWET